MTSENNTDKNGTVEDETVKKRIIIPTIQNGLVVLTIPPEDSEYPKGKVFQFQSFTPTNAVQLANGKLSFPNNDGLTADILRGKSEEELAAMSDLFQEAVQIIAEQERLQQYIKDLVNTMAPPCNVQIRLGFACLGKNILNVGLGLPQLDDIRILGFAYQGIELRDTNGNVATYEMVLDDNGKFNYDPDPQNGGILYRKKPPITA